MTGKAVHILWEGTQLAHHSFALVNRQHCLNLFAWDVAELTLMPYEPDQFSPTGELERLMAHDVRRKGLRLRDRAQRPHVWIRHQWPPRPKPPGNDRWVVMLPWEYSLLPTRHVDTMRGATEVWTPSEFSRRALVDSGVASPVHVIPNGIDPAVFSPIGERLALATQKRFKFLYVGGTIYRKGIDLLLQAYAQMFAAHDDVCLVIKDLGATTHYRGQTAEGLIAEHRARPNAPEILYLADDLPQHDVAALYRACDVLVAPYRGEGFCLPALEAMACGVPVIVTEGGSTGDFVEADVGWPIPAGVVSVGASVYGDALPAEGFLLQPDVRTLGGLMRRAYVFPEEVEKKGTRAAERAAEWTWQQATLRLLGRIDAMCGTRLEADARSAQR